jgi:hypothetical protein
VSLAAAELCQRFAPGLSCKCIAKLTIGGQADDATGKESRVAGRRQETVLSIVDQFPAHSQVSC